MPLNKAVNVDASTATFGSYNPSVLSGGTLNLSSFLSAIRSNYIINGGGTITYNSSGYLNWGQRLIVISGGRGINGEFNTAGYFDISVPADGTTIVGVGGAADRTMSSALGGILINPWESLYYVLPVGSNNTSQPNNFRIASYTANYDIPANWVRIATRNGDDNRIYLHNGITLASGQAYFASYTTVRPVLETLTSVSPASTIVPSVIRGASGQTGDLTQWQNSAATILTSINSSGHLSLPKINFTGGSTTISALTLADGTISFEGTAGQLFSVSNSLTGTIFSINDISGLPSVEVTDLGIIKLNELYGQTVIGSGTPATSAQLSAIARTSATIPLAVRGASGQSVNLQEWQNSTPTTVASISNTGAITAVDLTLSGNLTVNGTTTNINTTNLVVEDKNIILGDVATPSTTTADGGGITLLAGGSNKTLNWINATDRWTSSVGLEGTSIVRTGGTSSQFLKADGSVDSSAYITAAQTFNLGTTSIALNRASAAQSLTGITSIDGSAATLTTARTIGDASFNGSANIVPERIFYKDTRATNYNPFTYIGATLHLKTNTTDSLADGGTYHGVLDLAHWTDSSGGVNHQLGLTDNGNMWIRYSTGASTWSSWSQFAALTSTTPSALGTAAVGTAGTAARADHIHPTTGLGLTSGTLAQFAATTSAQLAGVISDETGSGSLVFALAPTIRDLTISRSDASIEGGQISLLKSIDNTIGFNIDVYGSTASPDLRIFNGAGNQVITFTTAGAFSVPSTLTASGSITGTSFIPSGSTVPTNGMYLSAANQTSFSANSSEKLRIGTTTALQIFGPATADADAEFIINGLSGSVSFYNALAAGNYNPNTALNDKGIIFHNGTVDTGSFIIAPWSNTSSGLKITNALVSTPSPFTSSGAITTGGALNLNYASPTIASNNASAASIFTSTVTGITIGSSTIRTTAFPADGTTSTAAAGAGFMGMPQVIVSSGGRTLAASDAGKHIYMTTTSGQTITIPANSTTAFPIGTTIVIINGNGISTTINITTDTLRLANTATTGSGRTLASNGMCTLVKINTTEWIIGGNGIS